RVLDGRELQVQRLRVREVDVADTTVGALDRLPYTRIALARLLVRGPRHGRAGAERPDAWCRRVQERGEVLRRAGAVGPVHDRDRRRRQLHALVVGSDRRVVPGLDVALEDLRQRLRRELELLHAAEVVRHRDGAGDRREVEERPALDVGGVRGAVGRVGPGELDDLVGEVLTPLSGAAAGVVDRDVGVLLLQRPDHLFVEWLLE